MPEMKMETAYPSLTKRRESRSWASGIKKLWKRIMVQANDWNDRSYKSNGIKLKNLTSQ